LTSWSTRPTTAPIAIALLLLALAIVVFGPRLLRAKEPQPPQPFTPSSSTWIGEDGRTYTLEVWEVKK